MNPCYGRASWRVIQQWVVLEGDTLLPPENFASSGPLLKDKGTAEDEEWPF